jgi:hypothetical protein
MIVKQYARAGMLLYRHDDEMPVYGDLVKCKRCKAVMFGTFHKWHDHWHDEHEDECDWEEWLAAIGGVSE